MWRVSCASRLLEPWLSVINRIMLSRLSSVSEPLSRRRCWLGVRNGIRPLKKSRTMQQSQKLLPRVAFVGTRPDLISPEYRSVKHEPTVVVVRLCSSTREQTDVRSAARVLYDWQAIDKFFLLARLQSVVDSSVCLSASPAASRRHCGGLSVSHDDDDDGTVAVAARSVRSAYTRGPRRAMYRPPINTPSTG